MSIKFAQHFLLIASSMMKIGYDMSMWDDEDGFFYDVLRLPDGQAQRLKVRSIVGLLPMCATIVVSSESLNRLPAIAARFAQFFESRPELIANIHDFRLRTAKGLTLVSVLSTERLRRILSYVFDEAEFLSPYGIRSLSRHHADFPYIFQVGSQESRVAYTPAESDTGMFGGNSNWRGPVWFPINILIIRALLVSYEYYGDDFRFECPVGSGKTMNLLEAAQELNQRLTKIFLPNEQGERPLYGGIKEFQHNPYWRNYILFHEYFHGDNGCGLGASHQTGWTGTIARLMHYFATMKS